MAKKSATSKTAKNQISDPHRRTAIGQSVNTRPTGKHARKNWKRYVGQGRP